MKGIHVNMGST